MDRLRALEVFVRVVELRSFTRAAAQMGIPRSTVSAIVQDLEERLGVRLLHRTTRQIAPTAEGSTYYEEATRILRELSEVEEELSGALARPTGRLRVDVPASSGRHVIAPALPAFLARYPDLVVELGSTDRPVDLIGEGIDCVIRGGDIHDESLVARPLGALPVITCAAPRYLQAHGTPAALPDLDQHRFVHFFSARTGKLFPLEFIVDGALKTQMPPHQVAANDADTWVALAVAGLGLIQAPCTRWLCGLLAEGALQRVLPRWPVPDLPMVALYPQGRRPSARVRVFVDWVVGLYRSEIQYAQQFLQEGRQG